MMKVINMSAGKIIEDEFGMFEDEVLNAEWTPSHPECESGAEKNAAQEKPLPQWMRRADPEAAGDSDNEMDFDTEDFMSMMYRSQE